MIPGKTYTPPELFAAAKRRLWWIVVPFGVLSVTALVVVMWLPRSYQSIATIQMVAESAADPYVRSGGDARQSDRLATVKETTLTRTRLESIVKDLDLYADMRERAVMELVIDRMRSDVVFKTTDRDVMQLGFTAQDPYVALAVATRLTSLFVEENARARGQQADATLKFLDDQVAEVRAKLDEQEKQLETYKTRYAGELPSQIATNSQQLGNAQVVTRSLLDSIGRDQEQRMLLQRQVESVQASDAARPVVTSEGAPTSDAAELDKARARLKELELRLTPEHPDVQRARRDVAKLEQQAAATPAAPGAAKPAAPPAAARPADGRARDLQAQIDVLDRRIAANQQEVSRLRQQGDEYSRRIAASPAREAELATLTRDNEDTKRQYSSLVQKQKDATMAADLAKGTLGERFRVIEPARLPQKPSSRGKKDMAIFGVALAFALSIGLAAVIEFRDSSLRTEQDVKTSLRLPVLAAIPRLDAGRAKPRS